MAKKIAVQAPASESAEIFDFGPPASKPKAKTSKDKRITIVLSEDELDEFIAVCSDKIKRETGKISRVSVSAEVRKLMLLFIDSEKNSS